MAFTEENGQMMPSGSKGWMFLNTLLGAAGTATGITALASKEPKHNGRHHRNCGCNHVDENVYFGSPSAFDAWSKGCEAEVELTAAFYNGRITQLNEARQAREVDINEKFNIWKSQVDADFGLYKSQRDGFDALAARIGDLETKVAVNAAIRPYQDRLIQCEIDKAFTAGINYTDRKTCKAIYGVVGLPNTPTTTVLEGANQCGCPRVVQGGTAA